MALLVITIVLMVIPSFISAQESYPSTFAGKPVVCVNGTPAVGGELIVAFENWVTDKQKNDIHRSVGATNIDSFKMLDADFIELSRGNSIEAAISKYSQIKGVKYAEPNYIVSTATEVRPVRYFKYRITKHVPGAPKDPLYFRQDGLNVIKVQSAWELSQGSRTVVVASVGTGVDYNHTDLQQNMWTNKVEKDGLPGVDDDGNGYVDDIHGFDFNADGMGGRDGDPMGILHGSTSGAGIIGAVRDNEYSVCGINRDVRIMALKYFHNTPYSCVTFSAYCIEYATLMKADIIVDDGVADNPSQLVRDAIAQFDGIFVNGAGMNEDFRKKGKNTDIDPEYPACFDLWNIISVNAVNEHEELTLSSNYGRKSVDLGAPDFTLSTFIQIEAGSTSGTGTSAYYVTGVCALLKAAYPNASNEQIIARVLDSADQIKSLIGKNSTTSRLNAGKALLGRSVGGRFVDMWVKVGLSGLGPSPRDGQAIVYVPDRDVVVLFGGMTHEGPKPIFFGDTWEWDGERWKKVSESGPKARSFHSMVIDKYGKVILFGGVNYLKDFGDTWTWDGKEWTLLSKSGPDGRGGMGIVYDSTREEVLLFGGGGKNRRFEDTWRWDGYYWKRVTKQGPGKRFSTSMTYDALEKRVVLYGGFYGKQIDDMWEWNGEKWIELNIEVPFPRSCHQVIYDLERNNIVLFGGSVRFDCNYSDTWQFDGKEWKPIAYWGPTRRRDYSVTYDTSRDRILLFGGMANGDVSDTWSYAGPNKLYWLDSLICGGSDYSGNGKADLAYFRPSEGKWYIQGRDAVELGKRGDYTVPGDYDGDGVAEPATLRWTDGTWYFHETSAAAAKTVKFGRFYDIPVPADYNGDGLTDIAVYRPSDGTWRIWGQKPIRFGNAAGVPVPGDYDGDGTTDLALFYPQLGEWRIYGQGIICFGKHGDSPVPADYNGDGKTDIAVYRVETSRWLIKDGEKFKLGKKFDIPVPGDYDGDGVAEAATFRPRTGTWHIRGQQPIQFGQLGDVPLVRGN